MAMNAVGGRCLRSANASPSTTSLADTYASEKRTRHHTLRNVVKVSRLGKRYPMAERTKRKKGDKANGIIVTARDAMRQSVCSV